MMDRTGPDPVEEPCDAGCPDARFSALLEDSVEDLYEHAPCGYLSTLLDGTIAKINATLLGWLGLQRDDVVGVRRFADLLTVGGRLYHETHFAPLLQMQGEINGVALELATADGGRLPVLVTSTLKTGQRRPAAADPHDDRRRQRAPRVRARAAGSAAGGRPRA